MSTDADHVMRFVNTPDGLAVACSCGWRKVLGHTATMADARAAAVLPHPEDNGGSPVTRTVPGMGPMRSGGDE